MRDPGRFRPRGSLFYLCAITIVSALVLGGGTRGGFLSDAILQLLALPLLLISLWRLAEVPSAVAKCPLIFCAGVTLVPLLQLIPLPPAIWTHLPYRQSEAEAFALLGRSLPWLPVSVAPNATWLSALALVVPVAVFLGTSLLDRNDRRMLSLVLIGAGLVGVFLGLSQVAQGPSSPLRFFDFSNTTEAVGFFANRNHFAALLYSLTLFAAAWAVDTALTAGSAPLRRNYETATIIALLASFTCLVVLVGAQAMARSRAGLGLTIVALLGAFALSLSDRRSPSGITPTKMLVGAVGLAMMFATQFALYRIMERFTSDPLQDARIAFARITMDAAKTFMPLGSGMGTFVPVYAQFEKPADVLINAYANRAHNDVLEMWLETGAVGLLLMAVFLAWFIMRSLTAWRPWPEGLPEMDASLTRAASLVVGLLVTHSLLDYPLRTGAMMAIFAFACALLLEPPAEPKVSKESASSHLRRASQGQHRTHQQWPADAPAMPSSPPAPEKLRAPRSHIQRWGQDVEWPAAWRKPPVRDEDRDG